MCYIVHVPLNPNNQVFVKNLTRQNMRQWKTNLSMLGAQCNVGALTVYITPCFNISFIHASILVTSHISTPVASAFVLSLQQCTDMLKYTGEWSGEFH
jgi:hypothetical protein